jgi:hypothetical protein
LQAGKAEASELSQQLAELNLQNHQANIYVMFFSKINKCHLVSWCAQFTGWCTDLAGVDGWLNQGTSQP